MRLLWREVRRCLWPGLNALRSGEEGFVLPFTIMIMVMGVLLIIPMLSYVSTVSLQYRTEREQTMMRFAAEAAINRVIADLRRGADAISTTYVVGQPHLENQPYQTFTVTTTYAPPSVTVNDYATVVTITTPVVGTIPTPTQQYIDPGTIDPSFATLTAGYAYLIRFFQLKASTLQVNWAYSPAGISRIGIWQGFPVSPQTGEAYPPGRIDRWPLEQPILDTGNTPANVSYNRSAPLTVGPGVYTIVFDNTRGQTNKTTLPFVPSGGPTDTWVYVIAYRDYVVTATAQDVTVSAYVRQIPGYTQGPLGNWTPSNVAWADNKVYIYSWNPP